MRTRNRVSDILLSADYMQGTDISNLQTLYQPQYNNSVNIVTVTTIDQETKAQKVKEICQKSHCQKVEKRASDS